MLALPSQGQACFACRADGKRGAPGETPYGVTTSGARRAKRSQLAADPVKTNCLLEKDLRGNTQIVDSKKRSQFALPAREPGTTNRRHRIRDTEAWPAPGGRRTCRPCADPRAFLCPLASFRIGVGCPKSAVSKPAFRFRQRRRWVLRLPSMPAVFETSVV